MFVLYKINDMIYIKKEKCFLLPLSIENKYIFSILFYQHILYIVHLSIHLDSTTKMSIPSVATYK